MNAAAATKPLTHKERTAWFRRVLGSYGPKARVSMYESCGAKWIRVSVPSYDARFTPDELEAIALAARGNNLTFARGQEVTVEQMRQMTGRHQFDFVCNEPAREPETHDRYGGTTGVPLPGYAR